MVSSFPYKKGRKDSSDWKKRCIIGTETGMNKVNSRNKKSNKELEIEIQANQWKESY